MKKSGIRKNNRGDSLILVIGCIALLSVLGIVILAKSVDNQTMKISERQAQQSFFEADSTSAELAGALEAIALEAVEDAFSDMMVEYGHLPDDATRKVRYKNFFELRFKDKIDTQAKLIAEMGNAGIDLSNMTVTYDNIDVETVTYNASTGPSETDIIKIKNVKIKFSEAGSETTITTDINVQTQVPDIKNGFRPTINCYFADFALIADGTAISKAAVITNDGMKVDGNLYVGDNLSASGTNNSVYVENATKVLVRGDLQIDGGGAITVSNGTVLPEGQGVWANGIDVHGGGGTASRLSTTNTNVYVADDMTVEGDNSNITMSGSAGGAAACEYVGYSGGESSYGLMNYKKSSAITINAAKKLIMNLSGLRRAVIAGTSYIHEDSWDKTIGGVLHEVEGVMQGESVAYKDMQAMYLIPGDCLEAGHNPVMGGGSTEVKSFVHVFRTTDGDEIAVDLKPYLATGNEVVTRVLQLDNGATEAAYVYLNFASAEKASQYVEMYLATEEGSVIKAQTKNLNDSVSGTNSTIQLPTDIYTSAPALTYNGTTTTVRPAVSGTTAKTKLDTAKMVAKQRARCLFTSLRETVGGSVAADYEMVVDGILAPGILPDPSVSSGLLTEITVPDPDDNTKTYKFYHYNGDLTITTAPYQNMNGILLVNGNVKVLTAGTQIKGLLLATGDVEVGAQTTLEADPRAIEVLLTNSEVAKYFNGFGGGSTQQYLSSEAVDITFDNWKKN